MNNHEKFWLDQWQENNIPFNQTEPNPRLQKYFPQLNLKPGATIFLPLCGKSIDLIWLVEQGYRVVGVELSEIACRDFFAENDLNFEETSIADFKCFKAAKITIYCGDIFKLTKQILGPVEAVYDRGGLVVFPEKIRKQYAKLMGDLTNHGCQILLQTVLHNVKDYDNYPFMVPENEIYEIYDAAFKTEKIATEERELSKWMIDRGATWYRSVVYRLVRN